MITKFKEIWGKTDDIILRYPMVLTTALIAAISAVVAIEIDHQDNQFLVTKLAFTGCLGISLMFGIKMLSQRIGKGFLLEILGAAFLVWFYFYLPNSEKQFTEVNGFVIFALVILSHLFVSFSGFLNKKPEHNFWQFNKNLFINIFLTAVFTGVLVLGVVLAILAVDKLFDFNFNNNLYPKTILFLAILGSTFIFLIFNDKGIFQLEKDGSYPQILKFFTQFVLIPLLLIYVTILYFYAGKILINWELPRGWVSYLILIYSVVGILALLLVHPLKEESAKSWVKVFSKIFYYTLIPLLVLLFVAIFTRILEYGYTEPRYFVLLLAIWLTTVVFYFIFYKKATIKFVPISLFIFGVFALIFPYANAFSTAKRSQKTELQQILTKNQLLENGKINFNKVIQDSIAEEISNKFEFLKERKQIDYLKKYFTDSQLKEIPFFHQKNINFQIINEFKNVKYNKDPKLGDKYTRLSIRTRNFNYKINGYSQLFKVFNYNNQDFEFEGNTFSLNGFNNGLTLYFNQKSIDLSPEIDKIINQYKTRENEIMVDEISFTKKVGNYELKFLLDGIEYNKYESDRGSYFINQDIIVLIKKL
jgi:hypothetical protein